MKHIAILLSIFLIQVYNAQNTVKYSTYKMYNSKKSYSIFIFYDNNQKLTDILMEVDSTDPIFKKSSIAISKSEIFKFGAYLYYLAAKKTEWDVINISNKTKEIIKEIEWDESNVLVGCAYEDGPAEANTPLSATYVFINGGSAIEIKTLEFDDLKRSRIFFTDRSQLINLADKLDFQKIQDFIKADFYKKSLLK